MEERLDYHLSCSKEPHFFSRKSCLMGDSTLLTKVGMLLFVLYVGLSHRILLEKV